MKLNTTTRCDMILTVAKHHRHAHHKHAHHKEQYQDDEPKSKLRKLAVPITLILILMYAAQWAARTGPINLAAGIAIAGAAACLWILHPRKGR